MPRAPVYVLEGNWDSYREVPLVLPYVHALAGSHREIDLSHRTIRCAEDIAYYIKKIPKGSGAMVYFACHGSVEELILTDRKSALSSSEVAAALANAKEGAVSFVHFGGCEFIPSGRRKSAQATMMRACDARWVSGYLKEVEWLASTFVDLALISEVFVPYHRARSRRGPKMGAATAFMKNYDQLARTLGLSVLSNVGGRLRLLPARLH